MRDIESPGVLALQELIRADAHGCTPIDRPAPRSSHYVMKLRRSGLVIDTIDEEHGGPFSGRHGYVLRSMVTILPAPEQETRNV